MNNLLSRWFPVVLMLLLAGVTYWLDLIVNEGSGAREHPAGSDPDFIVDNFKVTRMNATGSADYVLTAKRMEHVRDENLTRVTLPELIHYAPDKPPVQLDAERGVVTGNGDITEFYDNVVVRREGINGDPPLILKTQYLKAFPDKALASTDKPVEITEGDSVLTGVGMDVDNNTRVFHLLSQVRGSIYRVLKKQ
jgi:lipopolysaccharide export system protein LptC